MVYFPLKCLFFRDKTGDGQGVKKFIRKQDPLTGTIVHTVFLMPDSSG